MLRFRKLLMAVAASAMIMITAVDQPAAAQVRKIEQAPDPWVHRSTGTRFPSSIGDFVRSDVIEYNPDGTDASAGYNLVRDGRVVATVTIFVYPALRKRDCSATFANIEASIRQRHKGVVKLSEERAASPSGQHPNAAAFARYSFDGNLKGIDQPLRSVSYLFCPAGNKWLVAYRATWPAGADYSADTAAMIHSVSWDPVLDAR